MKQLFTKTTSAKLFLKAILIVFIGTAKPINAGAQDAYFSQFFMNPTYLNPAYTGSMKVPRASLQYRNQWPAMGNAYINYFAAFDTYIPSISSGAGFLVLNDVQGNGMYTETSFKAMFSKEIKLNYDWTMYGSISAGVKLNSLNFNKLMFADELYSENQTISGETPPENNTRLIPDFGAGILVFSTKYFVGIAADHLSEPDQSLYSGQSYPLKRKYTVHFEYSFPWYRPGHLRKLIKFTPNFVLQSQGKYQYLTYGVYGNRKGISIGVWNRLTSEKNTDMIFSAGFIGKQLKTAISYDVNINGVGLKSHGSVELTVSYLLKAPGRKSIFPFYEIPGEWDIH
jgi:Bacteroidetes-specific putative membrane protein